MKSRKPPSIDYNIIIGKCNIVIPRRTDTSIARRARPRLFSTMYRICGSANSLTNCSVEVSLGALSTTITSNVAKSNWSNASRHSRKSCARSRVQTTTEVGATGTWDVAGSGTGSDTTARHSSSLLTVESRTGTSTNPLDSVEVPYRADALSSKHLHLEEQCLHRSSPRRSRPNRPTPRSRGRARGAPPAPLGDAIRTCSRRALHLTRSWDGAVRDSHLRHGTALF